jgi:hypothetical protein
MSKGRTTRLDDLFNEMDPAARRLALSICRSYKRRRDIRAQKRVRDEFGSFLKELKRAEQALLLLERDLVRLDTRIRASLGDRIASWCRMIRRAHIPAGIAVPLPIPNQQTNYFARMHLANPVEPLEKFLEMRTATVLYARREALFLRKYLESSNLGRVEARGTFSRSGGLQYTLNRLFRERTTTIKPKVIDERIARVLNKLDDGGPSIDPDKGGCDAVRKAIGRMSKTHKLQCDQYLHYHLNFPPSN